MVHSPKVEAYIEKSAPFAKPILLRIRDIVNYFCPESVEDFKWSFPVFMYRGSILCSMAAFKQHCAFGFWLAPKLDDPAGILQTGEKRNGMGSLGKITESNQIPDLEVLRPYFVQAMDLIERGIKHTNKPVKKSETPEMGDDFRKLLMENPAADFQFEKMSPGKKKDYIVWIESAKTEKTRLSRLETALEWISEGKSLNWRYEKK